MCSFLIQEFRELTSEDQKNSDNLAAAKTRLDNERQYGRKKIQKKEKEEENDEINGLVVTIWKHFEHIDDPRADGNRKHELKDIVVIAIPAIIYGANNWRKIAIF